MEHLDVVEYILPRVVSGFVGFEPNAFVFQGVEEAFLVLKWHCVYQSRDYSL